MLSPGGVVIPHNGEVVQQPPNQGLLEIMVWPPYIGVAMGEPGPGPRADHEPYGDLNYTRGQIMWRTERDGNVLGGAHIFAPKGVFTHIVFFTGPHAEAQMMGHNRMDQPIVFDRPGIIEIDPIRNQDYLPRR